jgi:hypothetical protein
MERLARDKHSSLLQKSAKIIAVKKFYSTPMSNYNSNFYTNLEKKAFSEALKINLVPIVQHWPKNVRLFKSFSIKG